MHDDTRPRLRIGGTSRNMWGDPIVEPTKIENRLKGIKLYDDFYPVDSYEKVLYHTANWLVKEDKLDEDMQPISFDDNDTYLINTDPQHPDGVYFDESGRKLSNGMYLNVDYGDKTLLRYAKRLLKLCGLKEDVLEIIFDEGLMVKS